MVSWIPDLVLKYEFFLHLNVGDPACLLAFVSFSLCIVPIMLHATKKNSRRLQKTLNTKQTNRGINLHFLTSSFQISHTIHASFASNSCTLLEFHNQCF
jgi:hypothetical protein